MYAIQVRACKHHFRIPPLTHIEISVNGQRPDGRPDGIPENRMPFLAYCRRRRHTDIFNVTRCVRHHVKSCKVRACVMWKMRMRTDDRSRWSVTTWSSASSPPSSTSSSSLSSSWQQSASLCTPHDWSCHVTVWTWRRGYLATQTLTSLPAARRCSRETGQRQPTTWIMNSRMSSPRGSLLQ